MSDNTTMFPKKLRGFDPEKVIAYIEELDANAVKTAEENKRKLASLEEKIDALAEEKRALEEERDALSVHKAENESLKSDLAAARADNDNLCAAIAASQAEKEDLVKQLETVKAELEAAKLRESAVGENAKEYETMLADVGAILAEARAEAGKVIGEAKSRAEEILSDAKAEASVKSKKLLEESEEKVNENMRKVKYLYRRRDELAAIFRKHKEEVDSFFAAVDKPDGEKD